MADNPATSRLAARNAGGPGATDHANESQRQRQEMLADRARHAVAAREAERRRLAAELHDDAGANLAAVKLNLSLLARALPGLAQEPATLLLETQALLTDTIRGIRELCSGLRPAVLDHAGLVEAIETHCARFSRRMQIPVDLDLAAYDEGCAPEVELALLRVTQEALWNCAKHANATRIRVSYQCTGGARRLAIQDDGRGFDAQRPGAGGAPTGIGLLTMRERALAAGVAFSVESAPGRGTAIALEF